MASKWEKLRKRFFCTYTEFCYSGMDLFNNFGLSDKKKKIGKVQAKKKLCLTYLTEYDKCVYF